MEGERIEEAREERGEQEEQGEREEKGEKLLHLRRSSCSCGGC